MLLSILLDEEKPIWRPGDDISGAVRLATESEVDIQELSITLLGRSLSSLLSTKIAVAAYTAYDNDVKLYNKKLTPFSGPFILKPGQHDWRFEHTVPTRCLLQDIACHEDQDASTLLFNTKRDQRLSPTISEFRKSRFRYLSIDGDSENRTWLDGLVKGSPLRLSLATTDPSIGEESGVGYGDQTVQF